VDQPQSVNEIFALLPATGKTQPNKWCRYATTAIESILGLRRCAAIYRAAGHHDDPGAFMGAVLQALQVRPVVVPRETAKIPATGGCVVVANHPFGGLDGIILADLLLAIRPDVKVMANALLNRIPQLRAITIPVDPFDRPASLRANLGPIRSAVKWVKAGGMLVIFPAGEVAHLKLRHREISDPPWHPVAARIVRRTDATVVPVFFKGRNSLLFQLAGLLHPRLRTGLLARELMRQRGRTIHLKIGNPIPARWLRHHSDDTRMLEYLRWRTHLMGHARPPKPELSARIAAIPRRMRQRPVAAPQSRAACRRDVARLPMDQCLVQNGAFTVWHADAAQMPHLLQEIGRLRETAFRLAGEGTGRPCDLDRFDGHYRHLFLWDEATSQIAGAYRLGQTDRILADKGKKGLYTNTLFQSRNAFYAQLGPALEMGRSFVHPDYQKSYSPLLLLWRGICAFVVQNPRYRMLFGPVSISSDYSDLSRRLMATTLLRHSQAHALSVMVRPRKPARLKPVRVYGCRGTAHDPVFHDFKEVNAVVADIELHQKEVPVLLRQYLNLGGQFLAFNIDRHFSRVLDGLIVVDLLQTDRKTLARYMGPQGLSTFLAHHGIDPAQAAGYRQAG
jgi:putative hemolysin